MCRCNSTPKQIRFGGARHLRCLVEENSGKMPNIFGLMGHRPDVLGKFLPFYSAVMEGGTVEPRYKELAYLKTALINGCEY